MVDHDLPGGVHEVSARFGSVHVPDRVHVHPGLDRPVPLGIEDLRVVARMTLANRGGARTVYTIAEVPPSRGSERLLGAQLCGPAVPGARRGRA